MSFVHPSIYTDFRLIPPESYLVKDCDFPKNLLSVFLGTWVFMPLLDLYDIDFHV